MKFTRRLNYTEFNGSETSALCAAKLDRQRPHFLSSAQTLVTLFSGLQDGVDPSMWNSAYCALPYLWASPRNWSDAHKMILCLGFFRSCIYINCRGFGSLQISFYYNVLCQTWRHHLACTSAALCRSIGGFVVYLKDTSTVFESGYKEVWYVKKSSASECTIWRHFDIGPVQGCSVNLNSASDSMADSAIIVWVQGAMWVVQCTGLNNASTSATAELHETLGWLIMLVSVVVRVLGSPFLSRWMIVTCLSLDLYGWSADSIFLLKVWSSWVDYSGGSPSSICWCTRLRWTGAVLAGVRSACRFHTGHWQFMSKGVIVNHVVAALQCHWLWLCRTLAFWISTGLLLSTRGHISWVGCTGRSCARYRSDPSFCLPNVFWH